MDRDTALSILENGKAPGTVYLIDADSQAAADRAEAWAVIESERGYQAANGNIYFD